MCFRIVLKQNQRIPIPKKAKEDILVYKDLGKYREGKFYSLVINGKSEKWKKGWHYYELTPFKSAHIGSYWFYKSIFKVHGDAFHSKKQNTNGCTKMIIPKGALYYENEYEYVSSEIIYP